MPVPTHETEWRILSSCIIKALAWPHGPIKLALPRHRLLQCMYQLTRPNEEYCLRAFIKTLAWPHGPITLALPRHRLLQCMYQLTRPNEEYCSLPFIKALAWP
jgi:hypothetical protein